MNEVRKNIKPKCDGFFLPVATSLVFLLAVVLCVSNFFRLLFLRFDFAS